MENSKLHSIRSQFLVGDNTPLKEIYTKNINDCKGILVSKGYCSKAIADDIYTEAVLILRDNIIEGKIQKLSSVRNYLVSICLNIAREKIKTHQKIGQKENEVRSLLYDINESLPEVREDEENLISISKSALNALNEKCQKLIMAFYVHKLSMREIALEFKLSSSDVAKTLKRRCYQRWTKKVKSMISTSNLF